MWQTLNIIGASLAGVAYGAMFRRRPLALLLGPLALAAVEAGLIFYAGRQAQQPGAAPVWAELSHFMLLAAVLVAGATGVGLAAVLLNYRPLQAQRRLRPEADRGANWRTRNWIEESRTQTPPPAPPVSAFDQPARPAQQPVFVAPLPPPAAPALTPRPVAEQAAAARPNQRGHVRRRAVFAGLLVGADGSRLPCTIRDLSVGGARVRLEGDVPTARDVTLLNRSNGLGHSARIVWRNGREVGLRFSSSFDARHPAAGAG